MTTTPSRGATAGRSTAGRSTAGRSTAGRSTAGRSTAGRSRPLHFGAVLAVILAVVASACGSSKKAATPAATTPAAGGANSTTLVVARDMDLNSLDPARAYCDTCQIYLSNVYQTVIGLAPDNKTFVPELATSWSSDATDTTWTFHLNPAAKFSDGTPVTSKDVAFSWLRLKNIKGSAAYLMQYVNTIATPDAQTAVVTLSQPDSEFLNETNATYTGIINSTVAIAHGASDGADASTADTAEPWFLKNSAGSGPYMLQSYQAGAEVDFVKNPNYWGTVPPIQRVVMKQVANAVTQAQMLESGAADIAMEVDPITAKSVKNSAVTIKPISTFNFVYLALSPGSTINTTAPLDDKIRMAIRDAIDYKGMLNTMLAGAGALQSAPLPIGFPGSQGLPLPSQNVAEAQSLLAADGHPGGITITAIYPGLNVYGIDFNTAMQLVQNDLAKVKIQLKLQPVTFSVFLNHNGKGDTPLSMIYFAPDYYGSAQYLNFFGLVTGSFGSGAAAGLSTNPPVVNAAENTTFNQALASTSDTERASLYNQLAKDMIADNVAIPLVSPDLELAYRSDVKGDTYSACCNLVFSTISK